MSRKKENIVRAYSAGTEPEALRKILFQISEMHKQKLYSLVSEEKGKDLSLTSKDMEAITEAIRKRTFVFSPKANEGLAVREISPGAYIFSYKYKAKNYYDLNRIVNSWVTPEGVTIFSQPAGKRGKKLINRALIAASNAREQMNQIKVL